MAGEVDRAQEDGMVPTTIRRTFGSREHSVIQSSSRPERGCCGLAWSPLSNPSPMIPPCSVSSTVKGACRRAHSALHDLEAPPHVGQRALTVWLEPELAAPPEVAAKLNAYKLAVRNLAHNDVEQHPEPVA